MLTWIRRVRRVRSDDGFTLVELLVTISMLTIVMITLTAMVFEFMRQTNETTTRMNESSDQQFVSAYWQQDVSSLGIHGFVSGDLNPLPAEQSVWTNSGAGGCTAANPVVTIGWNDYQTGSPTDVLAAWSGASRKYAVYYATTAGGQTILHRKRCGGSSTDIVVARFLTEIPTVACADSAGASVSCASTSPLPASVSITLKVQDKGQQVHNSTGYTTVLTAERRQG
ncbi:prepilin-type N-terminal cleavage/methylation domain-containing protein [Nocardioides phosphati]|uniref:Prepilin-type N-terminal cleavage/methylation domain-containing protein n=1 Tax=Nocardioides phosphati TaxID=1867775 RepID=A0ABQ2N8F1_9ACTN|nr:prepilin-type N-terminal cleavage/methylation domain-containing protein [Nocardioides phosphati]GGO85570.1 prepilin-type N-terminal cleavage/methylation domain-containing protein [Nocardioides phosphati]